MADHTSLISYLRSPWQVDNKTRESLISDCQAVIESLETPIEVARKDAFVTLDLAVIRTAIQLDIFALLSRGARSYATQDIAAATLPPCDAAILSRLLRHLANPLHLVKEAGRNLWSLTKRGRVYTDPSFKATCTLFFDTMSSAYLTLPQWICTEPTKRAPTSFQVGHPDEEGYFQWIQKDESKLQAFHTVMEMLKGQYTSQDYVDMDKWIPDDISENDVAFVDIGGSIGVQCLALKEKRGSRPGRIINQDRLEVIQKAKESLVNKGVEAMAYDFFTEQPIKGAHIYYLRTVFHDWGDDDCIRILERIKEAMASSSTLLIDEIVLPEQGSHWMVTQHDLTMLAMFNSGERSEAQWRALLTRANLWVEGIHRYDENMAASIIVARLK
ncbi:S-adenosyl-L-methionine-dependent methyltransferase [Hypoxylon fuscum]|nr:S-adenosyl-L-methionine-dependent methyltransferase [Hypoxylon fuscum]